MNHSVKVQRDVLYEAVRHMLDQVQSNPDLAYLLLGTESHHRLCAAEAAVLDKEVPEVLKARQNDMQPLHRWRRPDVQVFRERLEKAGLPSTNDTADVRNRT